MVWGVSNRTILMGDGFCCCCCCCRGGLVVEGSISVIAEEDGSAFGVFIARVLFFNEGQRLCLTIMAREDK